MGSQLPTRLPRIHVRCRDLGAVSAGCLIRGSPRALCFRGPIFIGHLAYKRVGLSACVGRSGGCSRRQRGHPTPSMASSTVGSGAAVDPPAVYANPVVCLIRGLLDAVNVVTPIKCIYG